jgi:vacuolar-type H+-ATPase subunit H
MNRAKDIGQATVTARAIDRVLGAERDAEASLAQARQQADALLERARDDALSSVNRALDRTAAWQQRHAAALDQRLAQMRAKAGASARDQVPPDDAAIAAAVDAVAARLTGGSPDAGPDDARP